MNGLAVAFASCRHNGSHLLRQRREHYNIDLRHPALIVIDCGHLPIVVAGSATCQTFPQDSPQRSLIGTAALD
jgi:hypothetical protein